MDNIHGPVFVGAVLIFCGACAGSDPGGSETNIEGRIGSQAEACHFTCTHTQGYWKTHDEWPADGLTLGTRYYDADQLRSILEAPVAHNPLISLAHQLIAAKLNVAAGTDPSAINGAIAAADALLGGLALPTVGRGYPAATTSALVAALTSYNEGTTGPGHCP